MNKAEIESLVKKYEAGCSTLAEEQSLFDNAESSGQSIEAWSSYVKQNRKNAPPNFNNSIWESIHLKKIKMRRLTVGILSAAASIVLFISISINNLGHGKLSYKEKSDLLNEALTMISDAEQAPTEQTIIYENETIIIYTALEQNRN